MKIVFFSFPNPVPLAEELFEVLLDPFQIGNFRRLDVDGLNMVHPEQAFLGRGHRNENLIVRIVPAESALGHRGADDDVVVPVHLEGFADGIFLPEQVFDYGGPENGHPTGRADFPLGEKATLLELEIGQASVFLPRPPNGGIGVFVLVFQLSGLIDLRGHSRDPRNPLFDRPRILQGEGVDPVPGNVAGFLHSGFDGNDVGSELGDGIQGLPTGAFADGDHGNDRGHPDDDAQGGQKGPQLVGHQAPQGHFEQVPDQHPRTLSTRAESCTSRPSRI